MTDKPQFIEYMRITVTSFAFGSTNIALPFLATDDEWPEVLPEVGPVPDQRHVCVQQPQAGRGAGGHHSLLRGPAAEGPQDDAVSLQSLLQGTAQGINI